MFIDINGKKVNAVMISSLSQEGKIVSYKIKNGTTLEETFSTSAEAEAKYTEVSAVTLGGVPDGALIFKGSCNFADLPASNLEAGDTWNILDAFILGGRHYPAGTNVAYTGIEWDALAGEIDLSNYLAKDNTNTFVPTGDYNPSTKKYVDDIKTNGSAVLTLTSAGWDAIAKTQKVLTTINTSKRNIIDTEIASLSEWGTSGIYATLEEADGITFTCSTVPTNDLTFRVVSEVVTYVS